MRPHQRSTEARGQPAQRAGASSITHPGRFADGRHERIKIVPVASTRPDLTTSLCLDAFAPRAARASVALVDRPSPDLRDAVGLLTGELVTQALARSQSTSHAAIKLRVWMPAEVVRVELQGPRDLLAPRDDDHERPETRLIETLADRWSIDIHGHDACAWFEIDRQEARAAS